MDENTDVSMYMDVDVDVGMDVDMNVDMDMDSASEDNRCRFTFSWTQKRVLNELSWPVGSRLDSQKYTSKVNSCQDARQELTECLLKSLCEQTLQPIYYWREYLPKDELPQPLGVEFT